jgi:flagellar biogenesis protein FliO
MMHAAGELAAAVLLAALALGTVWVRHRSRPPAHRRGLLELAASMHLTPQVTLHVVTVAERRLLIGAGPAGVVSLADLSGSPHPRDRRNDDRCASLSSTMQR